MDKNILSTKFFILLSSLSQNEKKELLDLSSCLSFNSSIKIHELLSSVLQKDITKKNELFFLLFSNTNYDDRKLRNLFSRAFKLIQKFMAFKHFENNEQKYQTLYIEAFKEKNLEDLIQAKIDNWEHNIDNKKLIESDYFEQKLMNQDYKFQQNFKILSKSKRNFNISSKSFNKSLDEAFLIKKMKLFISSFNYQSLGNTEEEFTLLEEIIPFLESKKDWSFLVMVHYHLLMLHYKPEMNIHYEKLKDYYVEINTKVSNQQKREIFLLIQNYTIKKINIGEKPFLNEFFQLFKVMLTNNTIYENNLLSPFSYKNIVTVTLRLNETDWCINFIEKYKTKLDKKFRKDNYSLAKSKYYFFVKEYENALLAVEKIKFDDILSVINAKIISIKAYYELDDYDNLVLAIENLDKILQRKTILSKKYINRFKKFNKFLKRILKTNTKKAKEKLLLQIEEEKSITNKKWLKSLLK